MPKFYTICRLAIANILLPVATLIFGAGFFRYKPSIPVPDLPLSSYDVFSERAPFDRVVFMVIDALRR